MAADELLIVHLVTLCQKHVPQGPRRLEYVSTSALFIDFKCPCLETIIIPAPINNSGNTVTTKFASKVRKIIRLSILVCYSAGIVL